MNYIVITSIFKPTEAVLAFADLPDVKVIVAGDKKSPETYDCDKVDFLSWEDQTAFPYKLSKILPFNHYCRKMFGYLHAVGKGASVIYDTDDDNIPKANWRIPEFSGDFKTIPGDMGYVNIYELYTDAHVWPRGLPLRLINKTTINKDQLQVKTSNDVGIWQGLADCDPDVDAIYRLTNDTEVVFEEFGDVVLGNKTVSPFNSQNTFVRRELFPLLYLPSSVTFRFTDILRGIVAQPVCWAAGYKLGFTNATVYQARNPHDYVKDFESEVPMYLYVDQVFDTCMGVCSTEQTITENLYNCYVALEKKDIVQAKELKTLEAWLDDLVTTANAT